MEDTVAVTPLLLAVSALLLAVSALLLAVYVVEEQLGLTFTGPDNRRFELLKALHTAVLTC